MHFFIFASCEPLLYTLQIDSTSDDNYNSIRLDVNHIREWSLSSLFCKSETEFWFCHIYLDYVSWSEENNNLSCKISGQYDQYDGWVDICILFLMIPIYVSLKLIILIS